MQNTYSVFYCLIEIIKKKASATMCLAMIKESN